MTRYYCIGFVINNAFGNVLGEMFKKELTDNKSIVFIPGGVDKIEKSSFVMLMGGNPFKQKELCHNLDLLGELQNYNGVMLGFSAGAMLMSKYIIIKSSNGVLEYYIENAGKIWKATKTGVKFQFKEEKPC